MPNTDVVLVGEFPIGNTFGATVYIAYGGLFGSLALILAPWSGIATFVLFLSLNQRVSDFVVAALTRTLQSFSMLSGSTFSPGSLPRTHVSVVSNRATGH